MTEVRIPRDLETRRHRERPKMWQPAPVLPEPEPQPGYAYRWVRISCQGQADPRNVSAMLREGWEPVRAEEQPHMYVISNPNSDFKDNIEIGGLLLCKTPTEFVAQREAYYAQMNKDQMDSVDNNFMRENDPRMPLFRERKSTTTFGSGR